jgi:OmpA-OmpF porin, OOP family
MRSFESLSKCGAAVLGTAVLLLAAAPARAQVAPFLGGFYVALGGGVVGLEDADIDYGGALPGGSVSFDAGWAVSGAAGWRILKYFRAEVEISHRENDVWGDCWDCGSRGSMKSTTYMANGYVDFPVRSFFSGAVPYIGAGTGRAQLTQEIRGFGSTLSHSNAHAFAYQVIGGLEFPVIPRKMSLTLEYRYLATARPSFQDVNGLNYQSNYDSHTFLAGLRWGF